VMAFVELSHGPSNRRIRLDVGLSSGKATGRPRPRFRSSRGWPIHTGDDSHNSIHLRHSCARVLSQTESQDGCCPAVARVSRGPATIGLH
jgi:hypothetical protein